jgi:hypothetical protein
MFNWYDNSNADKVARSGAWRIMLWITVFAVFFALLGWLLWGLGVIGAPVKGAGDAFKQKESANNRIAKQELFEELYADYESTVAKIKPAKQAMKQNPDSIIKQTEYTGLQNYCLDVVAQYNAESNKYLAVDFKRADLPYELDRSRCTN